MSDSVLTILIIDDCLEDRETYKRLLKSDTRVYRFIECEVGDEGLNALENQPIDCILLDYRLPDMDGIEILDELFSSETEKPVPVVFLTGQGSEEIAVRAMKKGASDYLVKSGLDKETLKRSIRYAISKVSAELANQEKERMQGVLEMAGAVCHELNQPLQAICGYGYMMAHAGPEEQSREDLMGHMLREIARLKELTQQLMTLNRYKTKEYSGSTQIIDIGKASSPF